MIAEEVISGDEMYPLQQPNGKRDTTSKIEECEHKAYYDAERQPDRPLLQARNSWGMLMPPAVCVTLTQRLVKLRP
jgi:hypothetical protein